MVAGVPVYSLDHYIGGERVASADGARFADLSPIDECELLGEVARGQAPPRPATRGSVPPTPRVRRSGPPPRAGAARAATCTRWPTCLGAPDRRAGRGGDGRQRGAAAVAPARRHAPGGARLPVLRRLAAAPGPRGLRTPGATATNVSWDPAGVAVLITPWNAPLMLATWKVAPALAAGATVVLKPAEVGAPLTASLLADAGEEAGLPPGVLNVVQGIGAEAGQALVADEPRVARISFTGSGADGSRPSRPRRRRRPDAGQLRAGRQVAVAGVRRRRPGPGRGPGRRPSTTTPGRCAWPGPGCWWRRSGWRPSSPPGSPTAPAGPAARATRETRPPTSAPRSPGRTWTGWTGS